MKPIRKFKEYDTGGWSRHPNAPYHMYEPAEIKPVATVTTKKRGRPRGSRKPAKKIEPVNYNIE